MTMIEHGDDDDDDDDDDAFKLGLTEFRTTHR